MLSQSFLYTNNKCHLYSISNRKRKDCMDQNPSAQPHPHPTKKKIPDKVIL